MVENKLNDFVNYDKLVLYVKKSKLNSIIKSYARLGWELALKKDNGKYENIIDITFVRPHKLKNKDELQLLQVGMETNLNQQAKLEQNKHTKSLCFGLSFSVVALAHLCVGILNLINQTQTLLIVLYSIHIAIGVFLLIPLCFLPKIIKKEKASFVLKNKQLELELEKIYNKIAKISEVKNGN